MIRITEQTSYSDFVITINLKTKIKTFFYIFGGVSQATRDHHEYCIDS